MAHMQNPPTIDWPRAARAMPPGAGLKWVDNIQALAEARAHNRSLFLWLRHWYDHGQQFIDSRDWRDHLDQARQFFAAFVDGTFAEYADAVDAIEGWNEFNALGHSEHEVAIRVAGVRARAWVWANEYRTQPRYAHIRLIIGNVAVGNDVPLGYAAVAQEYDCLVGYHSYIPMKAPGRARLEAAHQYGAASSGSRMRQTALYAPAAGYRAPRYAAPESETYILPGEWQHYSGRWEALDEQFLAAGYSVDWIFTEAGEVGYGLNPNGDVFLRAFDGWRHETVCHGDFEVVLDACRYWLDNASATRAWREGRIAGIFGALFTSSENLRDWPSFQKGAGELEAFARMLAEYDPVPPPDPEPEPEPRSYNRTYYLLPQNAAGYEKAQARAAADATLSTVGFSADDACIDHPNLKGRKVICYAPGRIGGSAEQLVAWQQQHYPGPVEWVFREFGPDPNVAAVRPLSQRDPRWAATTLGEPTGHGKTIGNWGCLLVGYTMLAQALGVDDLTPAEMNARMVGAGAFYRQYIQPGALKIAYPDAVTYQGFLTRENPEMVPRLIRYITDGIPVLARVDFRPDTEAWEQHWVLIVEGGNGWIMADPWTGEIGKLADAYPIEGQDILEAVFYRPV